MFKILIPVDFSPDSRVFVEKGFSILPRIDEASFIYVVPLGMKELEDFMEKDDLEAAKIKAEKKMNLFLQSLNIKAGKITHAITDGDPARVLINLANNGNFDALLVGHRGYSYVEDFFIGSVTLKLISKVNIPVIVVKKDKSKEDILEMK
ncbi:MAG: universal stress protein [Thermoplasmatales archaeon]|nr:universal stress protein [Candidatus Thermoplasmatota archaeon]MDA8055696.1 universal stress protein [Thermoplasmatales archaeon]